MRREYWYMLVLWGPLIVGAILAYLRGAPLF